MTPSTPGVATRPGGERRRPEALASPRMEIEDLRRERATARAAMDAEIAAAEARVRSENERARIAAEKADAEANRVASAARRSPDAELPLEERED